MRSRRLRGDVPWWAYLVFAALLAPFALMAWGCFYLFKLVIGWPLESIGDWYAAIIFAVFGSLLLWYFLAVGWRVIRRRWN